MQLESSGYVNGGYLTLMKVPQHLDSTVAAYRKAISEGPYAGPAHDKGERTASGGWHVHTWFFEENDGGPEITLSVLRHGSTAYVAVQVVPYA